MAFKNNLPDEPRMVYLGNLSWQTKWQDLKDHLKQAGTIEFCKILTQDGTDWGRSRGVGYARYSSQEEAQQAVSVLNGSELGGRQIKVDAWTGAKPRQGDVGNKGFGFGKGKGFDQGFGKGGYGFKGGFQPYGGFGGFGGKGFQPFGKGMGKQIKIHGDFAQMVYVANLPWKLEYQALKDHFASAGTVEFVKVLTEDGSTFSRSKGMACLRFTSAQEADTAVAMLNGTEFTGRKILVDRWARAGKGGKGNSASF